MPELYRLIFRDDATGVIRQAENLDEPPMLLPDMHLRLRDGQLVQITEWSESYADNLGFFDVRVHPIPEEGGLL